MEKGGVVIDGDEIRYDVVPTVRKLGRRSCKRRHSRVSTLPPRTFKYFADDRFRTTPIDDDLKAESRVQTERRSAGEMGILG